MRKWSIIRYARSSLGFLNKYLYNLQFLLAWGSWRMKSWTVWTFQVCLPKSKIETWRTQGLTWVTFTALLHVHMCFSNFTTVLVYASSVTVQRLLCQRQSMLSPDRGFWGQPLSHKTEECLLRLFCFLLLLYLVCPFCPPVSSQLAFCRLAFCRLVFYQLAFSRLAFYHLAFCLLVSCQPAFFQSRIELLVCDHL